MHENDGVLQLYSQWNGITVNIQTLQMTTSGQRIWHKAASPLHTDGSTVFTRLRQYAPHTPQSASALYGCCVLLSCFEHIDRRHVRYLSFYKFKILSIARLKRIKWVIIILVPNIMAIHRTTAELWQFNGFSKWQWYAIFIFKMWYFCNCEYSSDNQCASSCKILWPPVKPLLRYGNFSIFQNGGRPPS